MEIQPTQRNVAANVTLPSFAHALHPSTESAWCRHHVSRASPLHACHQSGMSKHGDACHTQPRAYLAAGASVEGLGGRQLRDRLDDGCAGAVARTCVALTHTGALNPAAHLR
jgi:hypothetical protein